HHRGMRAVLQRVDGARVEVDGEVGGAVEGEGVLALVGVAHEDGPDQVATIARKICDLRILEGERSVLDAGAQVLVVSQFTLYGDTRKGRRPSWSGAAAGQVAEPLVDKVVEAIGARGVTVATGRCGAMMRVGLTNAGPFTVHLAAVSARGGRPSAGRSAPRRPRTCRHIGCRARVGAQPRACRHCAARARADPQIPQRAAGACGGRRAASTPCTPGSGPRTLGA